MRGSVSRIMFSGHFSSASAMMVWLVYATVAWVMRSASSHGSRSSSTRMRISSGMTIAGCVSLMWKATFSGSWLMSVP